MTQPDTTERTPEGVDAFLDGLLAPDDDALTAALETSDAEGCRPSPSRRTRASC